MKSKPYQIVVDTREQSPWTFGPDVETTTGTLSSGDYSIRGLENLVAIERKSLPDLIACVGPERERFCRELKRLEAYRFKGVIIESSMLDVVDHNYRSQTHPNAALASIATWGARHSIPFIWAGSAQAAAAFALATFDGIHRDLTRIVHSLGLTGAAQSPVHVASKRPRPDTGTDLQSAAGGNARPRSGKF